MKPLLCISILFLSNSLQTDVIILQHSKCFEKYFQQVFNINRNYENSIQACYDEDNINRRPPQHLEPDAEIERYNNTLRESCSNFTACNLMTPSEEFFHCQSETAANNMNTFFMIHLNASSLAVEFSEKYDEEEKELLRCQLIARKQYTLDSFTAYNDYLYCISATQQNCST